MIFGKAMRVAAGLNRLANMAEHLAASSSLADSPEYLRNQSPCFSQRPVDPAFAILIPDQ